MTTIAYRDNVLAADSQVTIESEAGGSRTFTCEKLYRRSIAGVDTIIGLAGGSTDGLVFLDWLESGERAPSHRLIEGGADFTALVLDAKGLWEYDQWCRKERVVRRFYAVGSGSKAALGALHMGADARRAVQVACKIDTYSLGPVKVMALKGTKPARRRGAGSGRPIPDHQRDCIR